MMLSVPAVLDADQVAKMRGLLDAAEWVDGRATAGYQSARAKDNLQVPQDHPAAQEAGGVLLDALARSQMFVSAALPLKVFPPLFNRYKEGQSFGTHVDNAVRQAPGGPHRIRTDLSATLFLCEPGDYDGGELVVEDTYGAHSAKLPAGHLVLYPSTSLHHVNPVTRGVRTSSFFWIQSMVRDDGKRAILFDLDLAVQGLHRDHPDHASAVGLTGVYHNLLRRWAEL